MLACRKRPDSGQPCAIFSSWSGMRLWRTTAGNWFGWPRARTWTAGTIGRPWPWFRPTPKAARRSWPGGLDGFVDCAARLVLETMDYQAVWHAELEDGAAVAAGTHLATIQGRARTLLTAERTLLNFVGRLSGVATLAAEYVAAVAGTAARIYDTRKTTPGWRRLEKYAVRCGGGHNHRTGLFDAILIKDNHLALGGQTGGGHFTPAEAVLRARTFCQQAAAGDPRSRMLVEVEVDSLAQLEAVLPVGPDIVLLDNMSVEQLSQAVRRRDELGAAVELEASGGVNLATVRQIADTGVDRISVGALTHSAVWLDVALDWQS